MFSARNLHCATMRGKTSLGSSGAGCGGWRLRWPCAAAGCGSYSLDFGRDDSREAQASQRRPAAVDDVRHPQGATWRGAPVAPTEVFPGGFPPDTFLDPGARRQRHLEDHPRLQRGRARRLRAARDLGELRRDLGAALVRAGHRLERAQHRAEPRCADADGEERAAGLRRAPAQPVLQPVLAGVLRGGARGQPARQVHLGRADRSTRSCPSTRARPGSTRCGPTPSRCRPSPSHPI